MYIEREQRKKKIVDEVYRRVDISDYVKIFLYELMGREKRFDIRINNRGNAERIKGLMNIPHDRTFHSLAHMRSHIPFWEEQKVDYVLSNLGKGYIFYFICNRCGRRAKYLYQNEAAFSPLCRPCCRLRYRPPTRKAREISRLIRKPYLSREVKYMLIKRIGITKEEVLNMMET